MTKYILINPAASSLADSENTEGSASIQDKIII